MADADSKTAEPTYGLTAGQVDQVMADANIARATMDVVMFALEANAFIDLYSDMEQYVPDNVREELDTPAGQFPLRSLLTAISDARMRTERVFDTVGNGAVHLHLDAKVQVSPSAIEESNSTQGCAACDSAS